MQRVILFLVLLTSRVLADPGISIDAAQLAASPHAAATATQIAARTPRMPALLAQKLGHPENEQLYTQLLAGFEQVVEKAKLAKQDVAVALAIYVAGSYAAYHGSEVSDRGFVALAGQLRDVLASTHAFSDAPLEQKQDMYETFAILGTLMWAGAKQKAADPALRTTGKSYLDALFGGNADKLQITDRGMSLGEPAAPAASLPPPPIAHLFWTSKMGYDALSESMSMREIKSVAFTDGSLYDGEPGNLLAFDPAADRAANPKRWGKWRKTGNGYEVNWGKQWEPYNDRVELHGGKHGEHIAGSWARQQTGGYGTSSTYRGTTLVLTADGHFDTTLTTHFSASTPKIETSGTGGSDHSGTYAIDGFVLELHYDDGKVDRHSFAIAAGGDWVSLDGTMMWSTAKKKK